MKHAFIALLVLFSAITTLAQKHNLFADVGTLRGFSATYNYRVAKHFGAGIGVQGYRFSPTELDYYYDRKRFVPGVFADLRLNIRPLKRGQMFSFLDLGIDLYKQDKSYYRDSNYIFTIPHDNGFYIGFGFGYFRRVTKGGGGPYTSLKFVTNWYTSYFYDIVSPANDRIYPSADFGVALSLGYRFGHRQDKFVAAGKQKKEVLQTKKEMKKEEPKPPKQIVKKEKRDRDLGPMPDQKHHLYADVGISHSRFYPGFSATYNYRPVRFIGLGVGIQGYAWYPTMTNPHQFVPGVIGDLRFNVRPGKSSQFFSFLNVGIDFYKHNNTTEPDSNLIYSVSRNNGTYGALGFGYFLRLTRRGGGLYTSVKIMTNFYKTDVYDITTKEQYTETHDRGTLVISYGFKF
jgi:hypothetical protein